MKKSNDNKTMFYSNYNSSMNGLNEWSQVVPHLMPWAQTDSTEDTINICTNDTNINNDYNNRSVMQFTAHNSIDLLSSPDPCTSQTATHWELLNNISTGRLSSNQHLKRRNDSSDEELEEGLRRPVKQYISEEKVSAIFNRMHITNNTIAEDNIECDQEFECNDIEKSCLTSDQLSKSSQIVLTDDLQNAINTKGMTDKLIQNEFDKLSKAVVVWRPTNPILPINFNSNCNEDNEEEEEENDSLKNTAIYNDYPDIEFTPIDDFTENDNEMELCP